VRPGSDSRAFFIPDRHGQADSRMNRAARTWARSPSRRGLTTRSPSLEPRVIAYRAMLDVPRELVQFTAKLLLAGRRRRGTPRGSRALTCFGQAVLGLRWFRDRTAAGALAADHGISPATAYRYVDEVIAVLAAQAPELPEALARAIAEGAAFVILDGKIIPSGRCREKITSVKGGVIDLWYSGKAHRHGGNIQAVARPDGFPLWVSPAVPGSVHDLTAARRHALRALYHAAASGLPALADPGSEGAGIGIKIPVKQPPDGHELAARARPASPDSRDRCPGRPRLHRHRPGHLRAAPSARAGIRAARPLPVRRRLSPVKSPAGAARRGSSS